MKGEGWRKPRLSTKTPWRTEGPQGMDKTRKQFRGMSETDGGQTDEVGRRRHRKQADDITTDADK
jgi:hypothetical protein